VVEVGEERHIEGVLGSPAGKCLLWGMRMLAE
jgi:hypothetical protein